MRGCKEAPREAEPSRPLPGQVQRRRCGPAYVAGTQGCRGPPCAPRKSITALAGTQPPPWARSSPLRQLCLLLLRCPPSPPCPAARQRAAPSASQREEQRGAEAERSSEPDLPPLRPPGCFPGQKYSSSAPAAIPGAESGENRLLRAPAGIPAARSGTAARLHRG